MRRAVLALSLLAALAAGAGAAQTPAQLQQRIDAQEAELRRLTAQAEQLGFELRRLREAQEARLQDLEFRIIELEGGDPTAAFRTGDQPEAATPQAGAPSPAAGLGAPPAALGSLRGSIGPDERAAFEAAMRDLEGLGPDAGRRSVSDFLSAYPDGALGAEALARVGAALAAEGRHQEAARVFLEGVRDHGDEPGAPEALLGLARSLAALGAAEQACASFRELAGRADAPPSLKATGAEAARRAGCL
ncbi:hypothetical protein [Rubrimonas cliftonensis]|uniref:TolA-binding protein n=1 Tax=Rubrimonas cliftonensis TaxID=89524 RepID=A0A1H4BXK3_9RHOB|nr:hypothetical protein [Rubrimonas cliftonensis]SEA52911.1 TolA-binding protein [Rubrimonas cliftonensis]